MLLDSCNKLVADMAVVINNIGLLLLLDNVTDICNNLLQEGAPSVQHKFHTEGDSCNNLLQEGAPSVQQKFHTEGNSCHNQLQEGAPASNRSSMLYVCVCVCLLGFNHIQLLCVCVFVVC